MKRRYIIRGHQPTGEQFYRGEMGSKHTLEEALQLCKRLLKNSWWGTTMSVYVAEKGCTHKNAHCFWADGSTVMVAEFIITQQGIFRLHV